MDELYKGYVKCDGKRPVEELKNRRRFKSLEEIKNEDSYAGVLLSSTMYIDVDDMKQSEILMNIVDDMQLNCKVIQTSRGRHFVFKNYDKKVKHNYTHVSLACGIIADIKVGLKISTEMLKKDGEERFVEWDIEEGEYYEEVPYFLRPINKKEVSFSDMGEGDGRNQELFNYILTLSSNGFSIEESKEIIRMINKYVLDKKLDSTELETILRDESFQKPVFYEGSTFKFDEFAKFIKNNYHVVRINGQLHVYQDGAYVDGYKEIERAMIEIIPNLRKAQRSEVISYMELIADPVEVSDARYIGFKNGVYDVVTDRLLPFTPDIIINNVVPWDYIPDAYNKVTDNALNKLSCKDRQIRMLLEECIGYCFYRRNELGKAFILTGEKSNGKSTFLNVLKHLLGDNNVSALDLKELGDRFSTSMMFGKLANIGDDISDEFMQGSPVATFKKIVTGNRIKAERKGQDPFEFNPYIKLLFSANDIPRMRDKTGAVLRRLVIIPFNATFSESDPDFDPYIGYKLCEKESIEYLIKIGIEGLRRVLSSNSFTESLKVEDELERYEEENNPIITFVKEFGEESIIGNSTKDVYTKYLTYCVENILTPMSLTSFTRQLSTRYDIESIAKRIDGKILRTYIKKTS